MSADSATAIAGGPVPSPCIDVCRMDAASGWCEGCWRSIDEIIAWGKLDDAGKRAIWLELDARRASRRGRTMTPITFWFDPVSPYAHLAFERLPQALEGCSYAVEYRPLLFAGLLKHWGQLGPAEIAPKRDWTYRQVAWLAQQHGIALQMPAAHPFNPLPLLRLLLACRDDGRPNRWQCETVLRHVWCGGAAADDAARLAALTAALQPQRDPQSDAVKQALRANTDAAVERGLFGVPTLEVPRAEGGSRLFWGADGLEMAAACLRGDPWFDTHWDAASNVAGGVQRRREP